MSSHLYTPPRTPPRASGGASPDVYPTNIHATRAENVTITSIDKVCEEIDTELEKLISYLISQNEHIQQDKRISEGWNDPQSWTCKSPFSTDMNNGFLIRVETGNEKVFGKTRGGDTQIFPCDAVIKYLEVGKLGGGINLYEQALINVCHNRGASLLGKTLDLGESDDSDEFDEFYYDDDSEFQKILNLWEYARDHVKSNYEMLGVIVIGFSEFPEVDTAVLVANPDQHGSVGQQIVTKNIQELQITEDGMY